MTIHTLHRAALLAALCVARPAAAFDTWWHAETTRQAAQATGFSDDARLVLQVENYLTDVFSATETPVLEKVGLPGDPAYAYMHFDALWNGDQIAHNWEALERNTLAALHRYGSDTTMPESFRKIAELTVLAASLHAVQDFYSHSNWVNYWRTRGNTVPLWFDIDRGVRERLPIYTGAYPDGSKKGHEDHASLNKDNSSRQLNAEAVEVAKRASQAWIERLVAKDPSLPWGEMKSYDIQSQRELKHFLEELDTMFLTSSSTVAGHFDGPHTTVRLFQSSDEAANTRSAAVFFTMILGEYTTWMWMSSNTHHLPSPYWSSHLIYHVVRDLADGMMLADKTYVAPAK